MVYLFTGNKPENMLNKVTNRCKIVVVCLSIAFSMFSCKTTSKIGKSTQSKKVSVLLSTTQKQNVVFNTLTIQGRATASIPGQGIRISLTYRINMISDSLIWMRLSKFGFEGARALITRDSVFLVDRTRNTAYLGDFAPTKTYLGMEANIDILQALFIGNFQSVPPLAALNSERGQNDIVSFKGNTQGTAFTYSINPKIYKLSILETQNISQNLHSIIQYADFLPENKYLLPRAGNIQVLKPEELTIEFKHNKIEFNPSSLSTSFSIPDNYERVSF